MKKKAKALAPDYMQNFSCIASKCEDNCCCANWTVLLDRFTYKKYSNIKDSEFKKLFDAYIKRNRPCQSDDRYARIEFIKGKGCPFLSDNGLCAIQPKMGEECLAQVCATYPRIINQVDRGRIELSANMSCLEASRLALLKPEGIKFLEIDNFFDTRQHLFKVLDTGGGQTATNPEHYFEGFRNFTIGVLQNRSYDIAERYIKAYQKYYRPFMDQHEYILENYLVNYVFKNLFPFGIGKSLYYEYVILVVHYALIKMHLIGMAGFHKRLDFDMVIRLVQAFSKIAEHIPTYLDGVIKGLNQMGCASMAHMAILIKN